MTITMGVLREKLHRKDLYIVSAVGILLILLFSGSNANVAYNGESLTSYESFTPIMHTVLWVLAASLSIAISIGTIPNEYRRGTSHLVWVRGVSQTRYHGGLMIGNLLSSLIVLAFLYTGFAAFIVLKGGAADLIRLPVSYLLSCLPVAVTCLLASAASIKLSGLVSGLISLLVLIVGTAHTLIETLANTLGGFVGGVLHGLLYIVPDLYTLQAQATHVLLGKQLDLHSLLGGLLTVYLLAHLLLVLRKKEA